MLRQNVNIVLETWYKHICYITQKISCVSRKCDMRSLFGYVFWVILVPSSDHRVPELPLAFGKHERDATAEAKADERVRRPRPKLEVTLLLLLRMLRLIRLRWLVRLERLVLVLKRMRLLLLLLLELLRPLMWQLLLLMRILLLMGLMMGLLGLSWCRRRGRDCERIVIRHGNIGE